MAAGENRNVTSRPSTGSSRWRRVAGTGISFATFGLVGLLLALVVIPVIRGVSGSPDVTRRRVRRLVHLAFAGFMRWMSILGVGHFEWIGAEALRRPGQLVVANHPTLIDAVAIIAHMPDAECVVKEATFRNPFMRGAARAAGYIANTGGVDVVEECARRIREGHSLLLFPEGTRSPAHELGPFHRGAAHIALAAGCNPLPVVITCDPPTLMKGQKWYDVPDRPFRLTVRVDDPIVVGDVVQAHDPRGRASRALTAALRVHFEKGLANV